MRFILLAQYSEFEWCLVAHKGGRACLRRSGLATTLYVPLPNIFANLQHQKL